MPRHSENEFSRFCDNARRFAHERQIHPFCRHPRCRGAKCKTYNGDLQHVTHEWIAAMTGTRQTIPMAEFAVHAANRYVTPRGRALAYRRARVQQALHQSAESDSWLSYFRPNFLKWDMPVCDPVSGCGFTAQPLPSIRVSVFLWHHHCSTILRRSDDEEQHSLRADH